MNIDEMKERIDLGLFRHLGIEIVDLGHGKASGRMQVGEIHLAPNGYLHAGSVVSLADSTCGVGTIASIGGRMPGFTTVELKSNFLGTVQDGVVLCEARAAHLGKTTQVWDAEVSSEDSGRTIALFRCTQLILS